MDTKNQGGIRGRSGLSGISEVRALELPTYRPSYVVDVEAGGIRFSPYLIEQDERDPRIARRLRLEDAHVGASRSKRSLSGTHEGLSELSKKLQGLSRRGLLRQCVITFGMNSDPFYPFEGKFDVSMKFLELFQQYRPGLLQIQTRSPLAVIAMPILKKLGDACTVAIGLETHREDLARRYTPELPRVEERLKMARALRNFGVPVQLQVAPLLPYGDWKQDAQAFADVLCEHSDMITLAPLYDGTKESERLLRNLRAVKLIAEERAFHYLRQDAHLPLQLALEKKAPEKLSVPKAWKLEKRQLEIFAA